MYKNLIDKISTIIPPATAASTEFISRITVKELPKDQFLLKEAMTCDFIAYVDSGTLRTYLNSNGKDVNTEFFLEGSFASAYTSFLENRPTELTIQALEDSRLFLVSRALLQRLYLHDAQWLAFGKYIFEQEFIKKCRRESSFLKEDAQSRYLTLLRQYPRLEEKVSLYHIASYLGIQPETLSRIRAGKLSRN